MKLRYIKNLFWYDGPICDLFIDDDGFDLYISCDMSLDVNFKDNPDHPWYYIVRKVDSSVTMGEHGVEWPKGFFDYQPDTFLLFDAREWQQQKDWHDANEHWFVEANVIRENQMKYLWKEVNNASVSRNAE